MAADDATRAENEAKLLVVSAMVATTQCRSGAATAALQEALARGIALGSPRLQVSALDNLAVQAALLGQWREVAKASATTVATRTTAAANSRRRPRRRD